MRSGSISSHYPRPAQGARPSQEERDFHDLGLGVIFHSRYIYTHTQAQAQPVKPRRGGEGVRKFTRRVSDSPVRGSSAAFAAGLMQGVELAALRIHIH